MNKYIVMDNKTNYSVIIYAQNDIHAIAHMIKNHGEAWRNWYSIRPISNAL